MPYLLMIIPLIFEYDISIPLLKAYTKLRNNEDSVLGADHITSPTKELNH